MSGCDSANALAPPLCSPGGEAPSSGSSPTRSKVNAVHPPDRSHSDSDDDSNKKRRVNETELKRNNNRKRVRFRIQVRPRYALYRSDIEFGTQGQPSFVDRHLKRKPGRLKVNSQLLATIPEALCDEFDCEQLEEVDKVLVPSDKAKGSQLHQPKSLNCISQAPLNEAEVSQLHQPRFFYCIS